MSIIVGLILLVWYVWSSIMQMLNPAGWSLKEKNAYRIGVLIQACMVVPAIYYLTQSWEILR